MAEPYDQDADPLLAAYNEHMDAHLSRPRTTFNHAEHMRVHDEFRASASYARLIEAQRMELRPYVGRPIAVLSVWLQWLADWIEDRAYVPKAEQ